MWQVAWTMHRGICRHQQDSMLVAGQVRQSRNPPMATVSAASDLLLAVGDGVALEPGDRIALCSDGVHDALGEACWQALLAARHDT